MLSKDNILELGARGYRYVVGARLANAGSLLIEKIDTQLPRIDTASVRFDEKYGDKKAATVCEYSQNRYKKDRRGFDKQVKRALLETLKLEFRH